MGRKSNEKKNRNLEARAQERAAAEANKKMGFWEIFTIVGTLAAIAIVMLGFTMNNPWMLIGGSLLALGAMFASKKMGKGK